MPPPRTRTTLGRRASEGTRLLWLYLREHAMTPPTLASRVGISRQLMHRILHGDSEPRGGLVAVFETHANIPAASWAMSPAADIRSLMEADS